METLLNIFFVVILIFMSLLLLLTCFIGVIYVFQAFREMFVFFKEHFKK